MARKKTKNGYVLKSDVLQIIQNYIRNIQMNDYGTDSGIPQLYNAMDQIDKMEPVGFVNKSRCHKCIHELGCTRDKDLDGKCPNYKKDAPDGGYYG